MKKTGIELIAQERQEQIEKHGWSLDRDQDYADGQLKQAALYCLAPHIFGWPNGWIIRFKDKVDNKTKIEQLTVAGALIAAEIDRLQSEEGK